MVELVVTFVAGLMVGGLVGVLGMAAAVAASDRRNE